MNKILFVVADCERKIWDGIPDLGPCKAASAFTSQYFAMNLSYAKEFGDEVRILSAKHGFVSLDFEIPENYPNRLTRFGERISLAFLRNQILEQRLYTFSHVIGLGGHKFASLVGDSFLEAPGLRKMHFPFAGLPIGEQQKLISRALWDKRFFLDAGGEK